jgi:superfamily II DNA or RNA helicase/HKD family nuclease
VTHKSLPEGLYDQLLTNSLAEALGQFGEPAWHTVETLSHDQLAERLIEALGKQLSSALDSVAGDDDLDRARLQVSLINSLIAHLRQQGAAMLEHFDPFPEPAKILRALHRTRPATPSPETGLAIPWLFTAGKGSPSLLTELRHEIACCDRVDILVSFITVSGVRKLFDLLQSVTATDANGNPRTKLRVLTTTYIGATEVAALDHLAQLTGCEVKVSLDGRRTRLHAKAWIFHRATGFGSAYVGSANLSGAALLGGLEWTVKFTQQGQASLFARAKAHFETLWNDSEFQPYDPNIAGHRENLTRALKREAGDIVAATTSFFDLSPKDYQREMLEQLATEREHDRRRNLVVAATGTGKTVVAAFDYRASCQGTSRPRLLFVAHRLEILTQARRVYREVLRDHSFGELLAGGTDPQSFDHVFATIQSVTSRGFVQRFGADYWHTVVVDECHRLAADSFHEFATSIQPKILLGLTATPERADGKPIFSYFDNRPDGSPAVEIRLWHALDLQLLSPFEYYGCDDETDFSEVPWDGPGEIERLKQIVDGNAARARMIVHEWTRLTGDPRKSRAIAFCVSVEHAKFMTERFNAAGLPALCVVGGTDSDERRRAPERLASGELCVLVTCDLYNEGVDLPSVDTLLLLRPTQSPVLFQQQIGRGLRMSPETGKQSCLVLDFVGRHRTDFRFDRLLSGITGLSRGELVDAVEKGFSSLPPGCHIHLEKVTREQVLQSLRSAMLQTWRRLRTELQAYVALRGRANVRLADFLREQALELDEIYRDSGKSGWTALKRDAGLLQDTPQAEDEYFGRRLSGLLHTNDPQQLELLQHVGAPNFEATTLTPNQRLRLQMLAYQIDGQNRQAGTGEDFYARLNQSSFIREELAELAGVLQSRATLRYRNIPGLEDLPLCLHACYQIREILTAAGWLTAERRIPFQAGVLPLADRHVELLFVTLDKSSGFHDRIAFHDYAISTERFHWQTQNSAGPDTTAGRRYLESPDNGWTFQLFVRLRKGEPYRACGPVVRESAEGDRPMSIVWRLSVPLPVRFFQEFSVLRGQ